MIRSYLSTLFVLLTCCCIAQEVKVTNLLCEHKVAPNGVDVTAASFSWQIISTRKGYLQSAYQFQLSKSPVFKSTAAIIKSDLPFHTTKKLLPAQRYYWRVRVWDQYNHP